MDMNKRYNDMIRTKLDSLDTLPEGYKPNLASKWEVLEAALGEQPERRTPMLVWIRRVSAVAAALLLIGGSGVLLINRPVKPAKQKAVLAAPAAHQETLSIPAIEPNVAALSAPEYNVSRGDKPHHALKKHEPLQPAPEIELTASELPAPAAPAEVVAVVAEEPLTERYTEVDFNEPVIQAQPPSTALVKSQRFRFKLGLGNNEQVRATGNTSPIGFKTGF